MNIYEYNIILYCSTWVSTDLNFSRDAKGRTISIIVLLQIQNSCAFFQTE